MITAKAKKYMVESVLQPAVEAVKARLSGAREERCAIYICIHIYIYIHIHL